MTDFAEGVPAPHVAVIGLGAMGSQMVARLASTLSVAAFDTVSENLSWAATDGARSAASPADAARDADVVVLAVRTLGQVEDALFGAQGAAASLKPGAVVVLTSTIGVPGAKSVATRLADYGCELLDLPVSGGPKRARDGDLLVLVGGSERAIEKTRTVVELLASTVAIVGPNPGDGQAMKTVNQLLCGVHIAAAAEALALAGAIGLDLEAALNALNAGAGASFMLANRGPRIIESLRGVNPEVLSRVDIFVKDMGIVTEAAREAGVAVPVAAAAEQVYRVSKNSGCGDDDDSSVVRILS